MAKEEQELDVIVFIGRLQPNHLAHTSIMMTALTKAQYLIVLLGSANQPRTFKNPFTAAERKEMVFAGMPREDRERIIILPLEDKPNDQLWAAQVQEIVHSVTHDDQQIGIIGHEKDPYTSRYLDMFPQWPTIQMDNIESLHATDIRTAYYECDDEEFDVKVGRHLPAGIHDFLKAFKLRPEYEYVRAAWEFHKNYLKKFEMLEWEPKHVTTDAVVVQSGHVLIVRRRSHPGKGLYALPGGHLQPDLLTLDNTIKELREETKLKVADGVLRGSIKDDHWFEEVDRSLRGRTITHAFFIELKPGPLPKVRGADDADKAMWVPISVIREMRDQMFEDHLDIIEHFIGQAE